ncbi:UPF0691 protein C9orf116-like [Silurus asotus]|uniref:UPF0691 protein C9orf116-like n=1 Tax=Silurus asotus TaxID=30991 RepID=A0AAD5A737_SILAS|nr:UPF0691 protein C9orf116-like [Silurus asotus]
MDAEFPDTERNTKQQQPDENPQPKTSDFYRVGENLPKRFNNPDWFKGYSKKTHVLYQTTNQMYGSKKPTVHEMPTGFYGRKCKFSSHRLKTGMFRDNRFNTELERSPITGPESINVVQDRINFHRSIINQKDQ